MSLSTQDRPTNPSKFFLKVKSGAVSYYSKDQAENVDVPVPFEFIVLDQLATVKGWSDADNSGYWSNEVKASGQDALTVRTAKGVKATGIWRDIKADASISGAKFNASVYIAHKINDEWVISNIAFSGASLNAWIEFIQANKGVMKGKSKVVISGFSDAKKGAVKYQVPVFEATTIAADELDIALDLDKELQSYLGDYLNYKPVDEPVTVEEVGDEPIDLNDIPF